MAELADTTHLLLRWREGEHAARDDLITRLHPELAQIAAARLRREAGTSLSTGDLINEAVVRMMRIGAIELVDRAHAIALASRIMRNILVDHVRARSGVRREHVKVELTTRCEDDRRFDLRELDMALVRLAAIDRTMTEIVEMRYFGGMTIGDIAAVTALSEATVKRRWHAARAWLADALQNPIDG